MKEPWSEAEQALIRESKNASEAHRALIRAGFSRPRTSVANELRRLRELGVAELGPIQALKARIGQLEAELARYRNFYGELPHENHSSP